MFLLCLGFVFFYFLKVFTSWRAVPQPHASPGQQRGRPHGEERTCSPCERPDRSSNWGRPQNGHSCANSTHTGAPCAKGASPWGPVPVAGPSQPGPRGPCRRLPAVCVSLTDVRGAHSCLTCAEGVSAGRRGPRGTEGSGPACQGGRNRDNLLPPDCSQLWPRLSDL